MTRSTRDERGAVIILMAIGMVALTLMVAIVIDLGSTRALRSQSRAAADAAATAGALDLAGGPTRGACMTAFAYAFINLGVARPSATTIGNGCDAGGMTAAAPCTSGPARVATIVASGAQVEVTNPVPNGHRLLRATVVGGGFTQPADLSAAGVDGTDCQRIGVEVTQPQSRIFGGVASSRAESFSVHSVARYVATTKGGVAPAVVILNRTACKSIDTANGNIWVNSTTAGPASVISDSDGTSPRCSGSDGILHVGSSGSLRAAAQATSGPPGQLSWFSTPACAVAAPPASCPRGFSSGSDTEIGTITTGSAYVGRRSARTSRTTRRRADAAYHCSNVPITPATPLCTGADPVRDADALAGATTAPAGFATRASCSEGPPITVDTWVDCAGTFEVKGGAQEVRNGVTVIFRGRLEVSSGGTLAVNVASTYPPPMVNGLPAPAVPAGQSRLIVGSTAANAVDISTNSSAVYLAQTSLYSRGGLVLSSLNTLHWSPPSSGPTKGLLYWSESTASFDLQGGPRFTAAGVVFQGNGSLTNGGSGDIDLTNVQLWVDKISLSGSPTVLLSPDPNNSITTTTGSGSTLIR